MHVSAEAENILVEKALERSALQLIPDSLSWRLEIILKEVVVVGDVLINPWLQRCNEIEEEWVVFGLGKLRDKVLDGRVDWHDWLEVELLNEVGV
jgi:hypothetical protein